MYIKQTPTGPNISSKSTSSRGAAEFFYLCRVSFNDMWKMEVGVVFDIPLLKHCRSQACLVFIFGFGSTALLPLSSRSRS
ncbi:hypothetical protein LENED_006691 [Lentinula edodes]|uniref:Uncharacterized protein n=1 Tax=Lentinula edodes TaxID=5353 RepID=A0A1Q3ECD6_LENED|nr:hypothetical protein LENED_006691 [Lentinula edodes]